MAQSRYHLKTLDPKVGTICVLGALGEVHAELFDCGLRAQPGAQKFLGSAGDTTRPKEKAPVF